MNNKIIIVLIIVLLIIIKTKLMKPLPNIKQIKILAKHVMRNDGNGKGHYGAGRKGHIHQGVDLVSKAGEDLILNFGVTVKKIGLAYANDPKFKTYHLSIDKDTVLKLLYVSPLYKVGDVIPAGLVIAKAQNIAGKFGGGMINHIHVEIIHKGVKIDPTPYLLT